MSRLPQIKQADDPGYVYVFERDNRYKIGFSRHSVERRRRDNGARLVLTIPVTQRPAQLEYILNNRFADKRLPPQGDQPGDKREWFALDAADLDWLRGLSCFMDATVKQPANITSVCSRVLNLQV